MTRMHKFIIQPSKLTLITIPKINSLIRTLTINSPAQQLHLPMFSDILMSVFYSNKSFDNPILGKMSCQVLKQTYYECKNHHSMKKKQDGCADLRYLMTECYTSSKPQEFNQLIMEEFKEAYRTSHFFESRHSLITEKLFNNTWSIFYNRNNLKKYEKYVYEQQHVQNTHTLY